MPCRFRAAITFQTWRFLPGVTANVIDAGAIVSRNSVNISANGARLWDNNVVLNGLTADNVRCLRGLTTRPIKPEFPSLRRTRDRTVQGANRPL